MRKITSLLFAMTLICASFSEAQTLRQLTNTPGEFFGNPLAIDDAGTEVFFTSSIDDLGTNPDTRYQLFAFDIATGVGTQILDLEDGTSTAGPSVSDDGQWILFSSVSNPTGGNNDMSTELFLTSRDGLTVTQLTDTSSPLLGNVSRFALSGDGSRAYYTFNGDNATGIDELWVVDTDGTNRRKVTSGLADVTRVHVNDDGSRAVFYSRGDFTGGNPDGNDEVFKVDDNGTTTTVSQLTSDPTGGSQAPFVSGSGNRVVFTSFGNLGGTNPNGYVEIFVVDWNGSNLTKLTTSTGGFFPSQSRAPTISDDGTTIIYASNDPMMGLNSDGSFEYYSIQNNGTGRTTLTNTSSDIPLNPTARPEISGSGNRIAFIYFGESMVGLPDNLDEYVEVAAMDVDGSNKTLLTDAALLVFRDMDLSATGQTIVFAREIDPMLAEDFFDIFIMNNDGSGETQLTNFGDVGEPQIAGDDSSIFFTRAGRIWRINADGTGASEIDPATAEAARDMEVSRDGSVVVFYSNNPLGVNPEANDEVYALETATGTLNQITTETTADSQAADVDATGTWMVFHSDGDLTGSNPDGSLEVFRCQTDGSNLTQITNGAAGEDSGLPTISNDGNLVAYLSVGNATGNNADGNAEVFVYDVGAATFDQLTDTTLGNNSLARMSGNGQWVIFASDSPIFESSVLRTKEFARVNVTTKVVQRLTARAGFQAVISGAPPEPDDTGDLIAWLAGGDITGENGDLFPEIYFADRNELPAFDILGGDLQTELTWTVNSGPRTYDVIRGDVENLSSVTDTSDLGPVVCIEDDSPDNDTFGFADTPPPPGKAYFFVYRGSEGAVTGPGSWGMSTNAGERQAGAGSCDP